MKLYHQVPDCDFYVGDMREVAAHLPEKSVHVVACSPPYWNLRDYKIAPSLWGGDPNCQHDYETSIIPATNGIVHSGGMSGETISGNSATRKPRESNVCRKCGACLSVLGLEKLHDCAGWAKGETCPSCFICHMRDIARCVWRVLRDDGTFWVNISDSYAGSGKGPTGFNGIGDQGERQGFTDRKTSAPGLKPKDRVGIPERLALALQSDGWTWRDSIHLCKLAPMPESVTDRTTQAHENLFLFTKKAKYYFDATAVKEKNSEGAIERFGKNSKISVDNRKYEGMEGTTVAAAGARMGEWLDTGRNPRSWMEVHPEPTGLKHYATFVGGRLIPRFAIRAGSSEYGVCSSCGNPWQRVTERTKMEIRRTDWAQNAGNRTASSGTMTKAPTSSTIGWRPTCTCDADVVPATCWDPFSGSGTTAVVARELGRRSIYTDASQPYADIAIKRMQETTLALPMTQAQPESAQQLTLISG